eukprot:s4125_g5.t1
MRPLEPVDPSLSLVLSLHTTLHRCTPLPADANLILQTAQSAELTSTVEAADTQRLKDGLRSCPTRVVQHQFQQAPVDLALLWRWFQVPNQGMQKRHLDPLQL